jgi:DNA (cytosine-5)-methyltransferase 1
MSPRNRRRALHLHHNALYDLDDRLRPSCHRYKVHSYKSVYGRMKWDEPAQTITTGFGSMGQGRFLHPAEVRVITPHEAARLQGLPDFFNFTGVRNRTSIQDMIGNAVIPKVAAQIVWSILSRSPKHTRRTPRD